jgi:hypothetical protein
MGTASRRDVIPLWDTIYPVRRNRPVCPPYLQAAPPALEQKIEVEEHMPVVVPEKRAI